MLLRNCESFQTVAYSVVARRRPTGNCGLRDYGVPGQLGLEKTPEEYVQKLVEVFREVRRVLRPDGTLWLNLGDSYAGSWGASGHRSEIDGGESTQREKNSEYFARGGYENHRETPPTAKQLAGIKPKDLVGIPWMVAFALRADGWWLRSDIIWSKPNPMPESVTDRPTKAHEYIFLLTKAPQYYYDAEAIKNPPIESLLRQLRDGYDGEATKDYAAVGAQNPSTTKSRIIENKLRKTDKQRGHSRRHAGFNDRWDSMTKEEQCALGSNRKTVWTVATQPRKETHFATFPDEIPEICIKAGTKKGDTVLDPFAGSGTTAQVAKRLGREYITIELNPKYVKELIEPSLEKINPLFNES